MNTKSIIKSLIVGVIVGVSHALAHAGFRDPSAFAAAGVGSAGITVGIVSAVTTYVVLEVWG